MANFMYGAGREGFLVGEINWDTAVIKAALVSGYDEQVTHKFFSDVIANADAVVASAELSPKTATDGVADAGDITFLAVPAGDPIDTIVVYQASGVEGGAEVVDAQKRLIACYNQSTGVPLPITPNGGDITIMWDNSLGLFTL